MTETRLNSCMNSWIFLVRWKYFEKRNELKWWNKNFLFNETDTSFATLRWRELTFSTVATRGYWPPYLICKKAKLTLNILSCFLGAVKSASVWMHKSYFAFNAYSLRFILVQRKLWEWQASAYLWQSNYY